jgi:diaminohydroxyphosphoribosylaminopyrimidine deaminase/5-amino-6-(5-phosphoribosylamino)uracil reductase
VEVVGPVLEGECKQVIAPFIARVTLKRPYVTVKWAESADGRVAGAGGRRVQISNERSMREVHELRARSNAILVGINTVLTDDPLLTARGVTSTDQPLAVVVDARLRLPMTSRLVQERPDDLVVYCSYEANSRVLIDDATKLRNRGVSVIPMKADGGRLCLGEITRDLNVTFDGMSHLLVESGPALAAGFFAESAADRLWVFRSPKRIDDESAPAAAPIPTSYRKVAEVELDGDVLTEYLNASSPVFFAPVESADLVRVRGGSGQRN